MKLTQFLAGGAVAAVFAVAPAPAFAANVVETIAKDPDLSTLLSAIEAAGLADQLAEAELVTVFAPTNEAFKALPPGVFEELQKNPAKLKDVVLYHVVDGAIPADKLKGSEMTMTALNGQPLKDVIGDGAVVKADIRASNGMVHVINHVLLARD